MASSTDYLWVHCRDAGLAWVHCSGRPARALAHGEAPDWAALPETGVKQVQLCLPGESVRIHLVQLPARNRRRFLRALPFALEERLLRDADSYQFIPLSKPRGSTVLPVAVIERETIDDLVEQAIEHGYQPRIALPEYLYMPAPPAETWSLDATAPPLLLRDPMGGAALPGGPTESLPAGLVLALERSSERPRRLEVSVGDSKQSAAVAHWRAALDALGIELSIRIDERTRSAWLATRSPRTNKGSLLNGTPAASAGVPAPWRPWLPSMSMAAALLLLTLGNLVLDTMQLRRTSEELQAEIESVYRDAFPHARNVVDARFQMEQKLAALRSDHAGPRPLTLVERLAELAPLLRQTQDSSLERIDFDGTTVTIEVRAPDARALEALERRLAKQVEAALEHHEVVDGVVVGTFRIGEAA